MKHIKLITLLLAIYIWIPLYSQSYSYYYKGEPIYPALDLHTIAITSEGEGSIEAIESYFESSSIEVILSTSEDPTRKMLEPTDPEAENRHAVRTYYTEIYIDATLSETDYLQKMVSYRSIAGVVSVGPCFTLAGTKAGLMNTVIVELKQADDVGELYTLAESFNGEVMGHSADLPLCYVIAFGSMASMNAMQAANALYETGMFEHAEPSFMNHLEVNSFDQFYYSQWAMLNVFNTAIDANVEQAWTITKGNPAIKTAIYDMGVEMTHPDLQNNVFGTGFDLMSMSGPAQIYSAHGTETGGIIAAEQDNWLGISGMAPHTKIVSLSANIPQLGNFAEGIGFIWAAINGIDIINCSWSGGFPSFWVDLGIAVALNSGRGGKGSVIVFSAGNDNTSPPYPANSNPLILCVGAVDKCGVRSGRIDIVPQSCDPWCAACKPGSNFGSEIDVVAGGSSIYTTDLTGFAGDDLTDYTTQFGGTSAAAPFVAATAALMLSANPNFTVQDVNFFIEFTAQKIRTDLYSYTTTSGRPNGTWNNQMGYGFVDAALATGYASMALCGSNPPNMTVTTNINAPAVSTLQTSNSITLSQTVNSGATGRYHAGSIISLTPGFSAANGSVFSAYIQGCSASPFNKTGNNQYASGYHQWPGEKNALNAEAKKEKSDVAAEEKIVVYPNPNNGLFTLSVNSDSPKIIQVFDVLNNLILEKSTTERQIDIDITNHASGVYFTHIVFDNTLKVERVIYGK